MTADELADLHPLLFHTTASGNGARILKYGLHPTINLVGHLPMAEQSNLTNVRRQTAVEINHPEYGRIVVNDNIPLSEVKLSKCLDDGLAPSDWLRILNSRVFFFTKSKNRDHFENARANRGLARDQFIIETRRFANAYKDLIEIAPINTGNTLYAAARRGSGTFAPLLATKYSEWSRSRPKKTPDRIVEVVVRGSVPDLHKYIVEFIPGGELQ